MSDVVIERAMAYGVAYLDNGDHVVVIVEKDEPDFVVDPAEPKFATYREADARAAQKNAGIGRSPREAWEIVSSSIRASRMSGEHWKPKGYQRRREP